MNLPILPSLSYVPILDAGLGVWPLNYLGILAYQKTWIEKKRSNGEKNENTIFNIEQCE